MNTIDTTRAVNLGDRVRDKISGFQGIVTGRTEYLNGCARVVIEPEELHDGQIIESRYFDEQQIQVIEAGVIARGDMTTGGPRVNTPPPKTGH